MKIPEEKKSIVCVNNVWGTIYDAQLKQKSLSNQEDLCWSTQQICATNLNLLRILYLEIFSKIRDPNLLKRLELACNFFF